MAGINTASARSILLSLGIGDFNATTVIPMMFYGPAQTDPQLTQSVLLVKHLQRTMQSMGAKAVVTGTVDSSWAPYFAAIAGPQWTSVPWFDIAKTLLEAKGAGRRFHMNYDGGREINLSGMGGFLDDISLNNPVTWILMGVSAWVWNKARKAR